jgi:hypothetical protein
MRRGGGNGTSSGSSTITTGTKRFGGAGRRLIRRFARSGFSLAGSARLISASAFKCHRRSLGVAGMTTGRLPSGCSAPVTRAA